MKMSQDKIEFPSAGLQDAVDKLWAKIHEINGTVNFLIERNKELKDKLDERGVISPEDIARMKEMERNIEGLELENEEYLGRIAKLEEELAAISKETASKKVLQNNYENLINAYNKLKANRVSETKIQELQEELTSAQRKNEEFEKLLVSMREEVGVVNAKLQQSEQEIVRLQKLIEHNEVAVKKAAEAQSALDKMNDMMDRISASRDAIQDEADALKMEIERLKSTDNAEIAELKKQIEEYGEERKAFENDIKSLSDRLAALKAEKQELENEVEAQKKINVKEREEIAELRNLIDAQNEQLASADSMIKSIEAKDSTIEQLSSELDQMNSSNLLIGNNLKDLQAKYEVLEKDYFEAVQTIDELKADLIKQKEESAAVSQEEFDALQNELQVKEKMVNDYAASEKDMLNKLQYLEKEVEEKDKNLRSSIEKAKENEEKSERLEALLVQKDANIDELIRLNKTLKDQVAELENRISSEDVVNAKIKELQNSYEEELNKITVERNRLEKELKAKANSVTIMEMQINNLKEKVREFEINQIKSDEAISLETTMRDNLITNIEKQLLRIEKIIGKQ